MKIAEKIETLTAQLAEATTNAERITAAHAVELESLRGQLAAATDQIAGLQASISTLDATIKDRDATISRLESEAKSAEQRAMEIAASVGVPPLTLDRAADERPIEARLESITDPAERYEFIRAHSAELINSVRKTK